MKHLFPYLRPCMGLLLCLLSVVQGGAQTCPDGSLQGSQAYSQTVSISGGTSVVPVLFPQMDPLAGQVTCANLCVTIYGTVTNAFFQNIGTNPIQASIDYTRIDQFTGPGLTTPINNMIIAETVYGPTTLAPDDGTPGPGPDNLTLTNYTALAPTSFCRTIDAATLSQFYGTGTVQYQYAISSSMAPNLTGPWTGGMDVTAGADVTLSYCTCPATVLPLNIDQFNVSKTAVNKAKLTWSAFDDPSSSYHYEAEVSTDGSSFSSIGTIDKKFSGDNSYEQNYTATNGAGTYYFRVKQVYANGYIRFSNIRQLELGNSDGPKFSVYPNPSSGIVGIKFDNIRGGQYSLKIFNSLGQIVVNKELSVNSSSYNQVAKLETGAYWIRLTDKDTHESSVNQIIIK